MTDTKLHKTGEVAKMLQVTGTTVRNYCDDFAPHLSEYTRRKYRKFTPADVATLKQAQLLMGEGHTKETVNQMLHTLQRVPGATPSDIQKYNPELYTELETLKDTLANIARSQQEQTQTFEDIQATQAKQGRAFTVLYIVAGFVLAGVVLAVVLSLVAVLR